MKTRTEVHTFTVEEVHHLCVMAAKTRIVGGLFIGAIGKPVVTVLPNGTVEVRTHVCEGTWDDWNAVQRGGRA